MIPDTFSSGGGTRNAQYKQHYAACFTIRINAFSPIHPMSIRPFSICLWTPHIDVTPGKLLYSAKLPVLPQLPHLSFVETAQIASKCVILMTIGR